MANFITEIPDDPNLLEDLKNRFDYQYYIDNNPDIADTIGTNYSLLWQHFIKYGFHEKRKYRLLNTKELAVPTQPPPTPPPVPDPFITTPDIPPDTRITDFDFSSIPVPRTIQLVAWPSVYNEIVVSCVSVYVPVEANVWHQGMGSIVTEDGLFITSCYLVSDKKLQTPINSVYAIVFPEYTIHSASLIAYEAYSDIALYQLNLPKEHHPRSPITWSNLDDAILGNPLYSIGQSANNLSYLPIIGILQDKGYENPPEGIMKSIVTSLPVTSGYLGAGIFDRRGRFIGQVSWIKRSQFSHLTGGVAVDVVKYVTDWMVKYKTNYPVPHLGILYIENTPQLMIRIFEQQINKPVNGIVVIKVIDGSPAHLAGIRPGMIITKFNDKTIGAAADASQSVIFSYELIKQKPRDYIYITTSDGDVFNIQLDYVIEPYEFTMKRKIYARPLKKVNIIDRQILDIFTDYQKRS